MVKLKPVPKRKRIFLDYAHEAEVEIDNFFLETKNYLENKFGENSIFEIKSFWLANENYFSTNKNDKAITDERIRYILYKDRVVAGVIERRTELNHAEFVFFRDLSKLGRA